LSGRGLCDELITRPEESYRLCCVVVCDLETSRMGAPNIYDISHLRVKFTKETDLVRCFRSIIINISLKEIYFPVVLSHNMPVVHSLVNLVPLILCKHG